MGLLIANAITTFQGPYDVTCDSNKVKVDAQSEPLDVTTFCAGGWKQFVGGLNKFDYMASGFWQANGGQAIHDQAWADLNASTVTTVSPDGTAGSTALLFQMLEFSYQIGASIGTVASFDVSGSSSAGAGLVGGLLILPKTTMTTTTVSGIFQIPGGVAAGHALYAALHIFGTPTGTTPTLDVIVQSAALVGFGSPTTRITFPQQTNPTGGAALWGTPNTTVTSDAFYRVTATIAGTSPSYTAAVAVGIR